MIVVVNKTVYILVVFSILLTVIEGESSHSRTCPKKGGKFPIPGSFCASFYICENWRVLREESCPSDQHFNPIKGWCDYKDFYPCLEKPRKKECPISNGRFLKNGTDCESYFDCCNGEPTEKKCPKGQLFDANSGKCDYEELVECDGSSKNKDCPKPNGKFLKPGTKCRIYFHCSKGKAKEKKCPIHQLFNVKSEKCDWKDKVTCWEKKKEDCPKPTGRFLKSGTDCKVYFDCHKGQATEKTCPKNQLFDSRARKCVKKELVTCKDEESSSESSSSESKESRESTPGDQVTPLSTFSDTISERLISDSTTEGLKSPLPISDSTTEEVKSPLPVTDSTTEEVKSPLPVTDSTTEEVKSPLPITDSTTEGVKSPLPVTDSTTEEVKSPLPVTDSTTEEVKSPLPVTDSTTEEIKSPLPTTDADKEVSYSTHYKITSDATPELIESTTLFSQTPRIMSESRTQSIVSTPQITAESTSQQTTGGLSTQEIPTSPEITKPTSHPTLGELTSDLPTIIDLTSTSTLEELRTTDSTTDSTLEPTTRETTVEEILSSTHFPTESPEVSTSEDISSSYHTEQSSPYSTKETTLEEIFTESEQSSSSFKTTQPSNTDAITEITSEIVDISSDSTTETSSSLETKSEIFISSTSDTYQSTIDPVLVGFVCPESTGYHPHPTNKHKFIGCVHGIAYIMNCPSNLVYVHEQRRCLYDN